MMRQLTIALSLFAAITSQQTLAQTTDPVVMTVVELFLFLVQSSVFVQ